MSNLTDILNQRWIGGWEEKNKLFLWRRNADGKREIMPVSYPRYFLIQAQDYGKVDKNTWGQWKKDGYYKQGKFVDNYAKIEIGDDIYRRDLDFWYTNLDNAGIKPLEGDISRLQRFAIDNGLLVANYGEENGPRLAFYDIETDDRKQGKIIIGDSRILSMAIVDTDGNEHFIVLENDSDKAERQFLIKCYNQLVQYDVLVGYNNYSFDDPYIEARLKYHKISLDKWLRIATYDIYNLFERQGTFRQYFAHDHKLDTISNIILKRGKVKHEHGIYETWLNNPELLKEYNLEDVRILRDMEKILQTVALPLSVSAQAGLLYSAGYSPSKCIDQMLLRRSENRRKNGINDFRYPTAFYRPEHKIGGGFSKSALSVDKRKNRKEMLLDDFGIDYEEAEGALVLDTVQGLYDKVYFADFNSLYPNVIRAFNIGMDTLVDANFDGPKNKSMNGVYYRTDFESVMAEAVNALINRRKEINAQMANETDKNVLEALDIRQRAVKELTNSFYGATAQWGARHYNKDIAESITSSGRNFLPWGVEFFAAKGHKVVLGDTDSLAFSLSDDTDPNKIKDEYIALVQHRIRNEYNAYKPEVLQMGLDKAFAPMLIIQKKNYVGWQVEKKGKPYQAKEVTLMGVRVKKSNFPAWAHDICMEVLSDIMSGKKYNADYFIRKLQRHKDDLLNGRVDKRKLLITARIGKPLDSYTGENPLIHVRIARKLRDKGMVVPEYSTISYLVTDGGNPLQGVDESEIDENQPDYIYYWNTILMQQVDDYLDIIYPEVNWQDYYIPKIKKPRKVKK